jgi:hypothetical protein
MRLLWGWGALALGAVAAVLVVGVVPAQAQPPSCRVHADCNAGRYCEAGACVPSQLCRADEQCEVGSWCDDRGTCAPPFEPMEELRLLTAPEQPLAPAAPPTPSIGSAPWVLLGTSLSVTVIGLALVLGGTAAKNAVEGADDGTFWSEVEDEHDRAPRLWGIGGTFFGIGAAMTVASIVWVVRARRAAEEERPAVALRVTPLRLVLEGTF